MSSFRKAKSSPKSYISDPKQIKDIVIGTLGKASEIVGSSLGPGGKITLIESDMVSVPSILTKDGVSIFRALGAQNSYEHVILEAARDAAQKTSELAGDGPQPLYAKVLTPNGFIAMGEIKIGMQICGTNGTMQTVLGVFPKGQKEIYEVEFSDERIVECCADHLWKVTTNYGKEKVMNTASLMEDYKVVSNGYSKYKYYTPNTTVEFNENKKEMPLDPYLVGLLIGDGSLSGTGSIELSLGKPKQHILDKIKLPDGIFMNSTFVESKNSYRVKLSGKTPDGRSIADIVETIGLLDTLSATKFIPKYYLYSSKQTREALLQGLLDTDGHVNVRDRFEYSTVSEELFKDFKTLTQSLGIATFCSTLERKPDSSYSNTPIHRATELKGYRFGNKIINIRSTGKFTEMQCIKVSGLDSLYITDNFIVTHNTTTATVLASNIVQNLYKFCEENKKYSPQKAVRSIMKATRELLIPYIRSRALPVSQENGLLNMVAKISANGDGEIADAVVKAFEILNFGESSHITIRQVSGEPRYDVQQIDGYPIPIGYEESLGKLHSTFLNDQANQRIVLNSPRYVLFDGQLNDLAVLYPLFAELHRISKAENKPELKNVVIIAHGFSESVISQLAWNWSQADSLNVIALRTPMAAFLNSQTAFLYDLSAFTGAKVFGLKDPIQKAEPDDLGTGAELFECFRFRANIVGDSDPINIEVRSEDLETQLASAESLAEKSWLQERIGKITNGIARLTIYGGSIGELREKHDRVEDAVLSCRAALAHGALPGGGRLSIDMALLLSEKLESNDPAREVLVYALLALPNRLLDNAGYNEEEIKTIVSQLIDNPEQVYDIENQKFGSALELGLFDSTKAVEESLANAVSIASVLGTMGGIIVFPRDDNFEREEAGLDALHLRNVSLGQE